MEKIDVEIVINGEKVKDVVPARLSLADFIRDRQHLKGTHLGCEHGVCGACTVEKDGVIIRSCITLVSVCSNTSINTIEGFNNDPVMKILRESFSDCHGLQCGYCTPGMLITARDLINREKKVSEEQIRVAISGNLCRCTGYAGIVHAIKKAYEKIQNG